MGDSLPKSAAGGAKASVRPRAPKTTKQAELGSLRVACEAWFDMAHQLEFIAGKEVPEARCNRGGECAIAISPGRSRSKGHLAPHFLKESP